VNALATDTGRVSVDVAARFRHSASMALVLRVADGTFVDVNPAFERIIGISRADALGRTTLDLDLWPDPQARAAIWARLRLEHCVCAEPVSVRGSGGMLLGRDAHLRGVRAGRRALCVRPGAGRAALPAPSC
jgi:PAS domain S-box-containing protein